MELIAKYSTVEEIPAEYTSESLPPVGDIGLTAGQTYTAAGVGVFEGELCVMTNDDWRDPDWFPAFMFETVDSTIPEHWIVRVFGPDDPAGGGWTFRLGYPALVNSLDHVSGVLDGNPADMEIHYLEAGTITPPQT